MGELEHSCKLRPVVLGHILTLGQKVRPCWQYLCHTSQLGYGWKSRKSPTVRHDGFNTNRVPENVCGKLLQSRPGVNQEIGLLADSDLIRYHLHHT